MNVRHKICHAARCAKPREAGSPTSDGQQAVSPTPCHRPLLSLLTRVDQWISQREAADDMQRQWQALEHQLALRARRLDIELTRAARGQFPEARAMRDLQRKIRRADRRLLASAECLLQMPATSSKDALAKIRLGLKLRQPEPQEDLSW